MSLFNNKLHLKLGRRFVKILEFPTNNAKNQISLDNNDDLYFSHNKEPVLSIVNNTITANNLTTNTNTTDLLNISSNFNITKTGINIK